MNNKLKNMVTEKGAQRRDKGYQQKFPNLQKSPQKLSEDPKTDENTLKKLEDQS